MGSAINMFLPSIGKEFTSSAVSLELRYLLHLLASAVTLLPTGKLSDIFGRGKFFKAGIILYNQYNNMFLILFGYNDDYFKSISGSEFGDIKHNLYYKCLHHYLLLTIEVK